MSRSRPFSVLPIRWAGRNRGNECFYSSTAGKPVISLQSPVISKESHSLTAEEQRLATRIAPVSLAYHGIRNLEIDAALIVQLHSCSQVDVGQRNLRPLIALEHNQHLIGDRVVFHFADALVEEDYHNRQILLCLRLHRWLRSRRRCRLWRRRHIVALFS